MTHAPMKEFWAIKNVNTGTHGLPVYSSKDEVNSNWGEEIKAGTFRIAGPFREADAAVQAPAQRKVVQIATGIIQATEESHFFSVHTALCNDGTMWETVGNVEWTQLPPIPQPSEPDIGKAISEPAPDLVAELKVLAKYLHRGLPYAQDLYTKGQDSERKTIAKSIDDILSRAPSVKVDLVAELRALSDSLKSSWIEGYQSVTPMIDAILSRAGGV